MQKELIKFNMTDFLTNYGATLNVHSALSMKPTAVYIMQWRNDRPRNPRYGVVHILP